MNKEILEFLRVHIPIIYDPQKNDLIYDKTNIYYKIREYILELERKIENGSN